MKQLLHITSLLTVLILFSGCVSRRPSVARSKVPDYPADPGYFLSAQQKAQLVGHGRVQDSRGGWYNIWICPGYSEPLREAGEGFRESGDALAKYGAKGRFGEMVEESGDVLEWALEDCLIDFTVRGTPEAWGEYFSRANERANARVFGWWMAHPWALFQSGVNTVLRVPVGLAGTAIGTVWGGAVVPAYYVVEPLGSAVWHAGVDGVALPGVAGAWNTVVSPPLALVGQKPAPTRVDGFWVRYISEEELAETAEQNRPLSREEKAEIASLSAEAVEAYQSFDQSADANKAAFEEKHAALRKESEAVYQGLEGKLLEELKGLLEEHGQNSVGTNVETELRDRLVTEQGMNSYEAHQLIRLLKAASNKAAPAEGGREYTDPVKESMDVIEDLSL